MQFQRGNVGAYFKKDPTLKLWLPFEERSGTTTRDFSGNGLNGTLNGGATFSLSKFGNGMYFEGTNSYVSCGNFGNTPSKGTIMFWMNSASMDNYRNCFTTYYNDGNNNSIRFEEDASNGSHTNAFVVVIGNGSSYFIGYYFDSLINRPLLTKRWYHIALTWDVAGTMVTGYLDGKRVFNNSCSCFPSTFPSITIGYGFYESNRYWKGWMDEVAIFTRILSPQEISQYYSWAIGTPKRKYIFAPSVPEPNFFPFF